MNIFVYCLLCTLIFWSSFSDALAQANQGINPLSLSSQLSEKSSQWFSDIDRYLEENFTQKNQTRSEIIQIDSEFFRRTAGWTESWIVVSGYYDNYLPETDGLAYLEVLVKSRLILYEVTLVLKLLEHRLGSQELTTILIELYGLQREHLEFDNRILGELVPEDVLRAKNVVNNPRALPRTGELDYDNLVGLFSDVESESKRIMSTLGSPKRRNRQLDGKFRTTLNKFVDARLKLGSCVDRVERVSNLHLARVTTGLSHLAHLDAYGSYITGSATMSSYGEKSTKIKVMLLRYFQRIGLIREESKSHK